MKLNDLQVNFVMVWNTESLCEIEVKDIKQSKYPIINGNPGAFAGKLRNCEEVRRNMRTIVIDEA